MFLSLLLYFKERMTTKLIPILLEWTDEELACIIVYFSRCVEYMSQIMWKYVWIQAASDQRNMLSSQAD